jgi:hypothetical protein
MRRRMTAGLFAIGSIEAEEFDRKFWRRLGAQARFAKTWELSLEAWRLAGQTHEDEPRLRRSAVRFRRL